MCTLRLNILVARMLCVLLLSCSYSVVIAHVNSIPEFLDKHVRTEATHANDGAKFQTQFDYVADDTLVTHSSVKLNNSGFEDHIAVGIVQNYGSVSSKVTYSIHRFNYSDRDEQNDDVTLDFQYQSLHLQHSIQDLTQVTKIELPFDLFAAQVDLSFSKTNEVDSGNSTNVLSIASQSNGLKIAATLKELGGDTSTDISTEYRPSDYWVMKFSYTDDSELLKRQFRGEYTGIGYRLAGEYSIKSEREQTHITSAIGIEKDTELAALKMRLEYQDSTEGTDLLVKIESKIVF